MPAASFSSTSDPPETFRAALERLLEQRHTPADIEMLRRALVSGQIAQATGERAVAIGGNVDDAIIVSGDNNIIATFKGPDADVIRQIFHQVLAGIESNRYARSLQDYFRALRAYCASLPYLTLHDIRPPKTLDEVYVPLQAQPQPREREEKTESQSPRDRPGLGPLSTAEVLQRHEHTHLLILGEPGAGKSTLLRQLAEHAWDAPHKIGLTEPHLPLLVPLQSLALTEGTLEERLKRTLASEMMLPRELPAGFFDEWPRQTGARWLLLFDGLDEVSADRRAELMRWLKSSLQWLEGHRLIVTTRPSGYARGELDEKLFGHYEILPFSPAQTDEFARKWFQEQAEAFLQELARVRAGALSGTPLLLTIAAKVYLEKQALPARRSALYDQFVDIWLREAIEHRGLKNELGERACKVAMFALAQLALAMTARPGKISEAELFQKAAEYLRNALHLSEDEAEVDGEKFVRVMARRSGVFLRRGEKYDWLHPTFREYLAAEAIVRECRQDPECVWKRAVSRWEDEHWREVALFALSVLSDAGKDITALVERIWKEGDEGLYFAGYALAEQVKIQDALAHQIITALLDRARRMSWIDFLSGGTPITILGELRGYPELVDGLLALVQDKWLDAWVRTKAVKAVGRLGYVDKLLALARDEQVSARVRKVLALALSGLGYVDELLALARDECVPAEVRKDAAEALRWFGRVDEAAEILLALARDERVEQLTRQDAAEALMELGYMNEAVQVWLTLVQDERVIALVRVYAANALGRLGHVDKLQALARDERVHAEVRKDLAEAMSRLGHVDEAAEILLSLARDERIDTEVRADAVETLNGLGRVNELLELAQDERVYAKVRKGAAEALGKLGREDEANTIFLMLARNKLEDGSVSELSVRALVELRRIDELLALARDERVDAEERKDAAEALGKLGREDEAAEILLALARDRRMDTEMRANATETLGKLGRVNELLMLAQDERVDAKVREDAAEALGKLGRVEEAAEILLALARDERTAAWLRNRAANGLSELGHLDEAIEILLALSRNERLDELERVTAADALARLGRMDEATKILLALAQDKRMNASIRGLAAKVLGKLGHIDEASRILLALAQDERLDGVLDILARAQAVDALGNLGRLDELLALVWDEHLDPRVRIEAATVLGELGRMDELLALARDKEADESMRELATYKLDWLGGVDELLALARDEQVSKWVRKNAAASLGRLGDARLLPDLERIAREDTDEGVRQMAQWAINKIRERMTQSKTDSEGSEE